MKLKEIIKVFEENYPTELAYKWDKVGLMVGDLESEVSKVMVVMEVNNEVLKEAIKEEVGLIITHHPLIFKPLQMIEKSDPRGSLIYGLIENKISLYSAHTNFDVANEGLNSYISKILELNDVEGFDMAETPETYLGRIGKLKESMTLEEVSLYIKEKLKLDFIKLIGKKDDKIEKLAIITGSGVSSMIAAKKAGCDVFLTGDIKYHDAMDALENGINLIDAGHFGTEKFFGEIAKNYLERVLPKEIDIIEANSLKDPFELI